MAILDIQPIKSVVEKVEKTGVKKNGGKRKGSGRKKSELVILSGKAKREILHRILDECKENGISNYEDIIRYMVEKAKKDIRIAIYVIDQAIGKAMNNIEGSLNLTFEELVEENAKRKNN